MLENGRFVDFLTDRRRGSWLCYAHGTMTNRSDRCALAEGYCIIQRLRDLAGQGDADETVTEAISARELFDYISTLENEFRRQLKTGQDKVKQEQSDRIAAEGELDAARKDLSQHLELQRQLRASLDEAHRQIKQAEAREEEDTTEYNNMIDQHRDLQEKHSELVTTYNKLLEQCRPWLRLLNMFKKTPDPQEEAETVLKGGLIYLGHMKEPELPEQDRENEGQGLTR